MTVTGMVLEIPMVAFMFMTGSLILARMGRGKKVKEVNGLAKSWLWSV